MKKYISIFILSLLLFSCSGNFGVKKSVKTVQIGGVQIEYPEALALQTEAFMGLRQEYVYDNSVNIKIKAYTDNDINSVIEQLNVLGAENKFIEEGFVEGEKYLYAKIKGNFPETLAKIRGIEAVIYAEPDYKIEIIGPIHAENNFSPVKDILKPFSSVSLFGLENGDCEKDPESDAQGYALGVTEALKAYKEIGYGTHTVWAGIIDTGTNSAHEDLKYSDSEKVVKMLKTAYTSYGHPSSSISDYNGANSDDDGHGTHCTGIIAAVGDNNKGIAGVAWKNVKLASYKGLAAQGGSIQSTYNSLKHLTNQVRKQVNQQTQATVPVNMSLGGPSMSNYALECINYALSKGVLPVVAMGNDGQSLPLYPVALPGVLAVGATGGDDKKAGFSTYGPWINVCAPGLNIISLGHKHESAYVDLSGTSMATPFVTGAITYLLSLEPSLTPYQIITILEETADKINRDNIDPMGKYDENGFSNWYGYGRINVYKAARMIKSGKIPEKGSKYVETVLKVTTSHTNIPVYVYDVSTGVCVTMALTGNNGKVDIRGLMPGRYKVVCRDISKEASIGNTSDATLSF